MPPISRFNVRRSISYQMDSRKDLVAVYSRPDEGLIVAPVPSLDSTKTPLTSENAVPRLPTPYFNNHRSEL